MGSCRRGHGDGGHAGQGLQPVGQRVDQFQGTLNRPLRLERVDIAEARQPRQLLVQARVVLHRAGAERIQPAVDREILLRQAGVMPDHLRLAQARQADGATLPHLAQAGFDSGRLRQIDACGAGAVLFEDQRLFQHQRAVAADGAGRGGGRRPLDPRVSIWVLRPWVFMTELPSGRGPGLPCRRRCWSRSRSPATGRQAHHRRDTGGRQGRRPGCRPWRAC